MTDFSDFLINNLKQNLEPEDYQILKNGHHPDRHCQTIKEEVAFKLPQTDKNQQIDYARRWAENINNNYCLDGGITDYNNNNNDANDFIAHNSHEDEYGDDETISQHRENVLACNKSSVKFKEMRCSFNKIDQDDEVETLEDQAAGKLIKHKILMEKKLSESMDRTFNDSVLNAKVRPFLPFVVTKEQFGKHCVVGTLSSSSQKITNNPVYESNIRDNNKKGFNNNENNNYDVVIDIDNEKTYHEVIDIDSGFSKLEINDKKNPGKKKIGFFKAFKALVFHKKKNKKVELRSSLRKSKKCRKKKKPKSYDLCQESMSEKKVDVKKEKKLAKKMEKKEKKLAKENLKKQLKAAVKAKKINFNDDDNDSNCYKDPLQMDGQNTNFSLKPQPVDIVVSQPRTTETMKECERKSREKMLFSWDKVVKRASKDPNTLKQMLHDQSDKPIDDYKKRKSAGPSSTFRNSNSEDGSRQNNNNKDDFADLDEPLNQLLAGAGKQGELIRSLFSYLNQYGDDGFTIKQPGMKGGLENNIRKQASKMGTANKVDEKQLTNQSTKNNTKSNLPYYLKCCLEVQPPGPGSTIGSRRITVEEGILNRSIASLSSASITKKHEAPIEQHTTEQLKQALHKLSTRINNKSDIKLDEKVLDKFIEELDGDGKAEVLKRKLSMFLKMKKSSQSNISESSNSFFASKSTPEVKKPTVDETVVETKSKTIEVEPPVIVKQSAVSVETKPVDHLADFSRKFETTEITPKQIASRSKSDILTTKIKDSDLEMFYFSSETPHGNKTLFKTRKIFRGFFKHSQIDNDKSESEHAVIGKTQSAKINSETCNATHQYQHKNIFKTLLKSKNHLRQQMPAADDDSVEKLITKQHELSQIEPQQNRELADNNADSRQLIPDTIQNFENFLPNRDRDGSYKKQNKTRLEKLINELSTPQAIQALRNRYDTNDEVEKQKAKITIKMTNNKAKFNGHKTHMKELVNVLNEKFGADNNINSSTISSRSNTQKRKTQKNTSGKNKIYNTLTSSRYTGSKRKNLIGTINGKNKSSVKKKRRSTRIGWR
jgi:hypothetical protein